MRKSKNTFSEGREQGQKEQLTRVGEVRIRGISLGFRGGDR